jgi:hypothetical protein
VRCCNFTRPGAPPPTQCKPDVASQVVPRRAYGLAGDDGTGTGGEKGEAGGWLAAAEVVESAMSSAFARVRFVVHCACGCQICRPGDMGAPAPPHRHRSPQVQKPRPRRAFPLSRTVSARRCAGAERPSGIRATVIGDRNAPIDLFCLCGLWLPAWPVITNQGQAAVPGRDISAAVQRRTTHAQDGATQRQPAGKRDGRGRPAAFHTGARLDGEKAGILGLNAAVAAPARTGVACDLRAAHLASDARAAAAAAGLTPQRLGNGAMPAAPGFGRPVSAAAAPVPTVPFSPC